jgi:hypothetical protein
MGKVHGGIQGYKTIPQSLKVGKDVSGFRSPPCRELSSIDVTWGMGLMMLLGHKSQPDMGY